MSAIHSVQNQSTPFCGRNLFLIDTPLREVVVRNGAGWAAPELETWGARLGSADIAEWARLANQFPPQLRNFDPCGRRIDEVEFHPAWHHLMQLARAEGLHAAPWQPGAGGAQVARAAKYYLYSQAENGTQCPLTMTFASVPVLRQQAAALPALAQDWLPRVLSYSYDPASSPLDAKHAALIGMGMTEKQGGSDLRANTSFAVRTGADDWGDRYSLVGHKWFFSVPQSDAHLVLAQTRQDSADGLSCFLMPRWRRDGSRNAIFVQRLKDKLGNRSNASAEVEFEDAEAWLVGAPGQGVRTILEMGNHTRMDCAIASAGVMRAVLVHALHHARERQAFGRRLSEQPLMQNLLADLCLESESALVLALRLARSYDGRQAGDAQESLLARILTPAAKYWICKRLPAMCAEAMEVMGGNGYVEEGPFARFYREAPLNSIWEGSGNLMCLDLLRVIARSPGAVDALSAELGSVRGANSSLDRHVQALQDGLRRGRYGEGEARQLAERVAMLVAAGQLVAIAPAAVSDAYCAARLDAVHGGHCYGTLPAGVDRELLLARALPQ